MNKKQKVLTILALVAFTIIVTNPPEPPFAILKHTGNNQEAAIGANSHSSISSIHEEYQVPMPLFMLVVFYAGLFFMLQDKRS